MPFRTDRLVEGVQLAHAAAIDANVARETALRDRRPRPRPCSAGSSADARRAADRQAVADAGCAKRRASESASSSTAVRCNRTSRPRASSCCGTEESPARSCRPRPGGADRAHGVPADLRRIPTAAMRCWARELRAPAFDALAAPLLRHFALDWSMASIRPPQCRRVERRVPGRDRRGGRLNMDLQELRRLTVRACFPSCRWWIGTNGATLRLLDASRAYAPLPRLRSALLADDEVDGGAAASIRGFGFAALDELVLRSERHRTAVGGAPDRRRARPRRAPRRLYVAAPSAGPARSRDGRAR